MRYTTQTRAHIKRDERARAPFELELLLYFSPATAPHCACSGWSVHKAPSIYSNSVDEVKLDQRIRAHTPTHRPTGLIRQHNCVHRYLRPTSRRIDDNTTVSGAAAGVDVAKLLRHSYTAWSSGRTGLMCSCSPVCWVRVRLAMRTPGPDK